MNTRKDIMLERARQTARGASVLMRTLNLSYNVRPSMLQPLLLLVLVCFSGCSEPDAKEVAHEPRNKGMGDRDPGGLDSDGISADCLLVPSDYEKFEPGRSKRHILKDVQWRGNFEMAAPYKGKDVSAISYGLFGGPLSKHGLSVLAIFVDDNFEKFVRWPEGNAKIKVGDYGILTRAAEGDPVSISDLEKEVADKPELPTDIDPDLTIAWLRHRGDIQAARAPALRKNATLRDQFNAARLKIGMRESEVESVLSAKPIESGNVDAGPFRIYGSTESFDITSDLHYSNVMVIFRDDKVTGIYSGGLVPGGSGGLQQMRRWFVDLPK